MPKNQPLDEVIPKLCPTCQAKLPMFGKRWDQKRATLLKFIAGGVLGGGTMLGVLGLIFIVGRLSVPLIMLVVGLSLFPSWIIFTLAEQIPKIKEIRCSKCRWTEYFFFELRPRND